MSSAFEVVESTSMEDHELASGGFPAPESRRKNCWEFMACGQEPGGARAAEEGVCPAALPSAAGKDGRNRGSFGGRSCWAVRATLCSPRTAPNESKAQRLLRCFECGAFKQIQEEEGLGFELGLGK